MQNKIHKELRESKFCILVDETLDKYDKQQMIIILRCVDCVGYIQEPFFKVVNVMGTITVTLKKKKYVISLREVIIWLKIPYAYYMHCFTYQLQLALVVVSIVVPNVELFFQALGSIVNVLTSFVKHLSKRKSI